MRCRSIGILLSVAAFAQTAHPTFDVASIKPAIQADLQDRWGMLIPMQMRGGPGTSTPGEVSFRNASLRSVVMAAYNVRPYQVIGPAWLATTGFNIDAKPPAVVTKDDIRVMLQSLLAERFHMVVHRETRELPAYVLTVGKGGAKLTVANDPDGGGGTIAGYRGNPRWQATNTSMHNLAEHLTLRMDRPVFDETGLPGIYNFTLRWSAQPVLPRLPAAEEETVEAVPTLAEAVQEQLGLKLVERKMPVEVVVVDRADRVPTGN
jgi:uncharacterized protein (TIGR03435 family)